jgi:hypothetical protein
LIARHQLARHENLAFIPKADFYVDLAGLLTRFTFTAFPSPFWRKWLQIKAS